MKFKLNKTTIPTPRTLTTDVNGEHAHATRGAGQRSVHAQRVSSRFVLGVLDGVSCFDSSFVFVFLLFFGVM